jgi:hypothetical protein
VNDNLRITEEPLDPDFNARIERFRRNGEWLTANGAALFQQFRGKYLAVAEGEVFISDDAAEARRLAKNQHPHDEPFVQYVPLESRERIYAY